MAGFDSDASRHDFFYVVVDEKYQNYGSFRNTNELDSETKSPGAGLICQIPLVEHLPKRILYIHLPYDTSFADKSQRLPPDY
jgi:hypothetical protein